MIVEDHSDDWNVFPDRAHNLAQPADAICAISLQSEHGPVRSAHLGAHCRAIGKPQFPAQGRDMLPRSVEPEIAVGNRAIVPDIRGDDRPLGIASVNSFMNAGDASACWWKRTIRPVLASKPPSPLYLFQTAAILCPLRRHRFERFEAVFLRTVCIGQNAQFRFLGETELRSVDVHLDDLRILGQ